MAISNRSYTCDCVKMFPIFSKPWTLVYGDDWYDTLAKIALTALVIILTAGLALIPMSILLANTKKVPPTEKEFIDIAAAGRIQHSDSPEDVTDKAARYIPFSFENQAFWIDVIESLPQEALNSAIGKLSTEYDSYEEQCHALIPHLDLTKITFITISNTEETSGFNSYLPDDILKFTNLKRIQFLNCGILLKSQSFKRLMPQMLALKEMIIFNEEEEPQMYDFEEPRQVFSKSIEDDVRRHYPVPLGYISENGFFVPGDRPAKKEDPNKATKVPRAIALIPNLTHLNLVNFEDTIKIPSCIRKKITVSFS